MFGFPFLILFQIKIQKGKYVLISPTGTLWAKWGEHNIDVNQIHKSAPKGCGLGGNNSTDIEEAMYANGFNTMNFVLLIISIFNVL